MNDNFFHYLHCLELIAFYSGYPLLYTAVFLIAGNREQHNNLKRTLISLLPYSYALVATLYMVFELNNLYPNYSFDNLKNFSTQPFLPVWGILALLFWIPVFARRMFLSLLHSLIFFILLANDIFFSEPASAGAVYVIRNDMKLYTASVILNSLSFITVATIYFLVRWFRSFRKSSRILN